MAQASSKESTADVAEQISALVDGFGDGDDLNAALDAAYNDGGKHWAEYQLVGDALRTADLLNSGVNSAAFIRRMNAALEREPHLLIPDLPRRSYAMSKLLHARRAIPAVAGLAAAVMVGWVVALQLDLRGGAAVNVAQTQKASGVGGLDGMQSPVSQLTALQESQGARAEGAVAAGMLRDPQVDEYLQAHAQYALQSGVSRLHNVSVNGREGCTASC